MDPGKTQPFHHPSDRSCIGCSALKCPYRQNFYFPIWSYISCNELLRKTFSIWIKSGFYELLKTWKSYFLMVQPCRWSQHRHDQSCDVDSGTCDFRLDLSRLFYLYKSVNYWAKFTAVKQARWVKPEITCSLTYVTTHSKRREDCCEYWTKMAANLNVFKTSKTEIAFYPNRIFLSRKFIRWFIKSNKKTKIMTIWAL